jgi:AraC-like DNA-binding protein/catechol 2,3-dioxygenase-like lactoylglutathione lyase family enzyme
VAHLVRTLAVTYSDGYHIPAHTHGWGQLVYAASGVMRVRAGDTLWLVPPAQAIWAPAGVRHEIWARGDFAMRTLYLSPELADALAKDCRAVEVAPLLRELILEIVRVQMLSDSEPSQRRLAEVAVDLIAGAAVLPVSLPMPRDPRAVRVAERLKDDPACETELGELSSDAGASARTMQRIFLDETGLRFSEWRQRLRLLHAASLIGEGVSVTDAGLEAGYASTSAFIAAFRKRFGRTPARMKAGAGAEEPPKPFVVGSAAKAVAAETAQSRPAAYAQEDRPASPAKGETSMPMRFSSALLGVTDMDRSIVFYRDILGFPLVDRNPAEGYARLDAGGVSLKLLSGHEPMVTPHPVLEIEVEDMDAAYAALSAEGVPFPMPPTLMPWGGVLARIEDPDGHVFYLTPPD